MKKRFSIAILKKRWAFSLIELSIVILIIGIVVAGITQGSRLVREMRIQAAASLTKSSGINGIKGLSMWLETTSSSSITSSTRGLNPDDNDKVAGWNDINSQKSGKINVTQTSDSLRPTYIVDGIGNLPSIKFDGTTDYLISLASAGGSVPLDANSDNFTYVAVWLSNTNSGAQVIFEQNSATLTTGKRASMLLVNNKYGFSGQANDAFGASYGTSSSPHISVMTVGQANGVNDANLTVKVYTNSNNASYTFTLTGGATKQNVGVDAFYIGAKVTNNIENLNGMISEIIIFDRVLMKEEISEVVNYLSKKYRIKLS